MKLPSPGRIRPGDLQRFAFAATVVAILDISFAVTYWVIIRGVTTFPRILQSIASSVLGKGSFQGGTGSALLGALLHCCVAAGWTALFLLLVRRWPAFHRLLQSPGGAVKTGMPYGILVWLVMNFVVIGLSRSAPTPVMSTWFAVSLVWHAIGVGLPIAVIMRD